MNTHKMFRSLLFACMGIILVACANTQTQPTILATNTATPTATVAAWTATPSRPNRNANPRHDGSPADPAGDFDGG